MRPLLLAGFLPLSLLAACVTPGVAQGDGHEPTLRDRLPLVAEVAPPPEPLPPAPPPRRDTRERVREAPPLQTLASANAAARQRPLAGGFVAARHVYTYAPGAIYELYANPNYISSILLEPGESITAIAAGDTSRWMVTEAEGENEIDGRSIVLVKPNAANLRTNIVLITDRRSYVIEASAVTGQNYSAQIAWSYPQSEAEDGAHAGLARLYLDYRIRTVRGRTPIWAPLRVFDDGRRTWIEFDARVVAADLPPLFVMTPEGAELVNYRVQGQRYMVDRVFDRAELRLGTRAPIVVRIERGARLGQEARG